MRDAFFAAAILLVGCGGQVASSTSTPGPTPTPTPTPTSTSTSTSDAGTDAPSILDAEAPLPPTLSHADTAFYAMANANRERLVYGEFGVSATPFSDCTVDTSSGCAVTICDEEEDVDAPATTLLSVGAVSASSPSLGTNVSMTMPTYGLGLIDELGSFSAGEVIHLVTTGGTDIPAIDVSVTMPPPLTSVSIDSCPTADGCVLTNDELVVAWQGGAGARVGVVFETPGESAHAVYVVCAYDGDAGRGKVPAGVLRAIGAGAPALFFADVDGPTTTLSTAAHSTDLYAKWTWPAGTATVTIGSD